MFFFFVFKDPGGLTDYIAAEYIPDFLGGPYEVKRTVQIAVCHVSVVGNWTKWGCWFVDRTCIG